MNTLKFVGVVWVALTISACGAVNEKIVVADEAANRMVGKLDDSKINQSINSGLNAAGDKITGFMPEAIRPPAERLASDESPTMGINPDPEITTSINLRADAQTRESANATGAAAAIDGTDGAAAQPAQTDPAGTVVGAPAEANADLAAAPGRAGSVQAVSGAAPVVLAPENRQTEFAEKAPARLSDERSPDMPTDLIELTAAGVTLKRVNIRLGPGTDHDVLDTIEAGTPLRVAGRTRNDWLLIEREGQPFGFILGSLVRTAN